MLQCASVSTDPDHNPLNLHPHYQSQEEDPEPMVQEAIQSYTSPRKPLAELSLESFLSKELLFHLSEDFRTSASSRLYDKVAGYTKIHRLSSVRDDFVPLLPHASKIHDYVKLLSGIQLYLMKNRLPHHLHLQYQFSVTDWNSSLYVMYSLLQIQGNRLLQNTAVFLFQYHRQSPPHVR